MPPWSLECHVGMGGRQITAVKAGELVSSRCCPATWQGTGRHHFAPALQGHRRTTRVLDTHPKKFFERRRRDERQRSHVRPSIGRPWVVADSIVSSRWPTNCLESHAGSPTGRSVWPGDRPRGGESVCGTRQTQHNLSQYPLCKQLSARSVARESRHLFSLCSWRRRPHRPRRKTRLWLPIIRSGCVKA